MMKIVAPLSIESVSSQFGRIDQPHVVQIAFCNDMDRTAKFAGLLVSRVLNFAEDMSRARVEDGMDGVDTQAVEVEVADPIPHIVEHERAHGVAAPRVEVH